MVWPSVAVRITAEVVHAPGPDDVDPDSPEDTVKVGRDSPEDRVGVDSDSTEGAVEPGVVVVTGSRLDVTWAVE